MVSVDDSNILTPMIAGRLIAHQLALSEAHQLLGAFLHSTDKLDELLQCHDDDSTTNIRKFYYVFCLKSFDIFCLHTSWNMDVQHFSVHNSV